jgi:magnesium-transporting ATPase (P-type)
MFITLLLVIALLLGLVLLVTGVVLLIKTKNKIAGATVTAIGLVFTVLPIVIFLALTITTSVQGGM